MVSSNGVTVTSTDPVVPPNGMVIVAVSATVPKSPVQTRLCPEPEHDETAELPAAPTATVTSVSAVTAAGAVAVTRTVRAPPSSPTAVNAAGDAAVSVKDKSIACPGSNTLISASDTATAAPPTDADPDNTSPSPTSACESSRAVSRNVSDPLVAPAGMDTVNWLPALSEQTSPVVCGHTAVDNTAPPDAALANVTVTSVAVVKAELLPRKAAFTVIACSPAPSSTDDCDTVKSISASSSSIVTELSAADTPSAPVTVPDKTNVSGPSTTLSSTTVNPANAADPDTLLAFTETVFGEAGA